MEVASMTVTAVVRASLRLLGRRDRRLLALAAAIQMATSLLDIVGVVLLGMVGSLAVSASSGQPPPAPIAKALSHLGLTGLSTGVLIAGLSGAAAVLLLTKSVLSPLLIARSMRFLARQEATVSAGLAARLFSRPLTFIQQRSSQQTAFALFRGVNAATTQVLGQSVIAAAESALLAVLVAVLFAVNPLAAVAAVAFFGLLSVGMQRMLGHRATAFRARRRKADLASLVTVQEAVGAYREITVADRRALYVDQIGRLRARSAEAATSSQIVAMMPKYLVEAALILGAAALAAVLFTSQPIGVAAGTFAIFLAAATRIMPALLRLQSAALAMRGAAGEAAPTFALADALGYSGVETHRESPRGSTYAPQPDGYPDFAPTISLRDVTFTYPSSEGPALGGVSVDISAGHSLALVGPSGAGKSTLADVILGVLTPQEGNVTVGGLPPGEAVRRWPGGIGYVPQDVTLSNDSLRANVALGIPGEFVDEDAVWDALRMAHLDDFVRALPEGLDTQIGERGLRLSGGQRQRLGIARALFSRPRLLVLDEATSALDAETERAITAMLDELGDTVTTVVVAHRLSTVRHCDLVAYLEDGRILAAGTFTDVRALVPALERQATLMGLHTPI
jgi:ABC-type multidrug transport system fused ATPase/permease subunit